MPSWSAPVTHDVPVDDPRVDEEADARRRRLAQRARTDVPLGEHREAGEVRLAERRGLGGEHRGLEPLDVDLAVARHADRQRLTRAVGMADHDDDVLQRVGGGPRATIAAGELGTAVEVVDERGDRRRVRRVVDDRGRQAVDRPVGWRSDAHRLDVGGVAAARAAHERVLTARDRRQELLAGRPTHRPGHRRDDDERHAEALERLDVGVAVALVGDSEPVVVESKL